jgi:hypothetical protein
MKGSKCQEIIQQLPLITGTHVLFFCHYATTARSKHLCNNLIKPTSEIIFQLTFLFKFQEFLGQFYDELNNGIQPSSCQILLDM